MLPELDDYDWKEVFDYADGSQGSPSSVLGSQVSAEPFTREDVKRIISMAYGENEGPDWVIAVELNDGRFACVRAGCDYTGWD